MIPARADSFTEAGAGGRMLGSRRLAGDSWVGMRLVAHHLRLGGSLAQVG